MSFIPRLIYLKFVLPLDALLSGLRLYLLSNDFFILLVRVSFMPHGLLPHLPKILGFNGEK